MTSIGFLVPAPRVPARPLDAAEMRSTPCVGAQQRCEIFNLSGVAGRRRLGICVSRLTFIFATAPVWAGRRRLGICVSRLTIYFCHGACVGR